MPITVANIFRLGVKGTLPLSTRHPLPVVRAVTLVVICLLPHKLDVGVLRGDENGATVESVKGRVVKVGNVYSRLGRKLAPKLLFKVTRGALALAPQPVCCPILENPHRRVPMPATHPAIQIRGAAFSTAILTSKGGNTHTHGEIDGLGHQ